MLRGSLALRPDAVDRTGLVLADEQQTVGSDGDGRPAAPRAVGVLSAAEKLGPLRVRIGAIDRPGGVRALERNERVLGVHGSSSTERNALERRRVFERHVTAIVAQAQREGDPRVDLEARLVARLIFGMSTLVDSMVSHGLASKSGEWSLPTIVSPITSAALSPSTTLPIWYNNAQAILVSQGVSSDC